MDQDEAKKKLEDEETGIEAYRDRMTAPIGAVRIDPITRQPIKGGNRD